MFFLIDLKIGMQRNKREWHHKRLETYVDEPSINVDVWNGMLLQMDTCPDDHAKRMELYKNGKLDMELQASLCTGSSSWAALPATPSTSRRVWRRGGFRRFAVSCLPLLLTLHVAGELQAGHAGQQAVCSWGAHAGLGGLDAAWQSRWSSFSAKSGNLLGIPPMLETDRCLRLGFQGWAAGVWALFWDIQFVAEERTMFFFFFSKIDVWELYRLTPHFPCFGISWWRKGRSESDVTSG